MLSKLVRTVSISSVLVGMTQPVLAGFAAVPAPIVGAGLPLLALAAGAYVAVKVIRARWRR